MWARAERPNFRPLDLPGPEGLSDVAVVDVGSNSVRLVLYRVEDRAIWTVFNEKVLAGLGRGLAETGRLSPDGVEQAMGALRRFRAVLDGVGRHAVFTAATAAVREASDGAAFVARVARETGLQVRVLSGAEEAHYSALGVLAGQPGAEGVMGDLGGSSLELTRLVGGRPEPGVTLPLGPFALGAPKPLSLERVRGFAAERLAGAADRFRCETFFAVGGAWRNLALIQMSLHGYPLRVVHQYEMSARDALEAARFVARQSRTSLDRLPGVSKKRADTLPYAALVLEQIVERLGVKRIVLSAYGLREGLIYDAMGPATASGDPLVEGCAALGARQGMSEHLGPALEAWLAPFWSTLEPLFPAPREQVLLAAAARLADAGARLHPDHRGELVFEQVLRAPIAGQSHPERAYLALAAYARYASQPRPAEADALARVLSPERTRRARALGSALRLGCDLSGRSPVLLRQSSLARDGRALVLTASPEAADLLMGEQTRKRLAALAEVLDLEPRTRTAPLAQAL